MNRRSKRSMRIDVVGPTDTMRQPSPSFATMGRRERWRGRPQVHGERLAQLDQAPVADVPAGHQRAGQVDHVADGEVGDVLARDRCGEDAFHISPPWCEEDLEERSAGCGWCRAGATAATDTATPMVDGWRAEASMCTPSRSSFPKVPAARYRRVQAFSSRASILAARGVGVARPTIGPQEGPLGEDGGRLDGGGHAHAHEQRRAGIHAVGRDHVEDELGDALVARRPGISTLAAPGRLQPPPAMYTSMVQVSSSDQYSQSTQGCPCRCWCRCSARRRSPRRCGAAERPFVACRTASPRIALSFPRSGKQAPAFTKNCRTPVVLATGTVQPVRLLQVVEHRVVDHPGERLRLLGASSASLSSTSWGRRCRRSR